MFQFRRFPSYTYLIQCMIPYGGFPHSEISGSKLICSSPKLIAACHVLHRLLMPRHSPCALISLTSRSTNFEKSKYWFSSYVELCRLISRYFCLAKIVFLHCSILTKRYQKFPLLLPSHNCIIIHNVQFSRYIVQANFAHSVSVFSSRSCRKLHIASLLLLSNQNPLRWAFDLFWRTLESWATQWSLT